MLCGYRVTSLPLQVDLTVDKYQLTKLDQIHRTGTMAHIQQLEAGPGGAIAMLMAHRRCVRACIRRSHVADWCAGDASLSFPF